MSNRILTDCSLPFSFKEFIFSWSKLPSPVFLFHAQLSCPNEVSLFFCLYYMIAHLFCGRLSWAKYNWEPSLIICYSDSFLFLLVSKNVNVVELTTSPCTVRKKKFSALVLPEARGCSSSLCLKLLIFTFFNFIFYKCLILSWEIGS